MRGRRSAGAPPQQQAERSTQTAMETVFANKAEGGQAVGANAVSTRKTTGFRAFLRAVLPLCGRRSRWMRIRSTMATTAYGLRHLRKYAAYRAVRNAGGAENRGFRRLPLIPRCPPPVNSARFSATPICELLQENTSFFGISTCVFCSAMISRARSKGRQTRYREYMERF